MSITIQPYPTVMGMQRALGNVPGVAIPIKYIRVGKGLQQIQLDDAGRAITESLKTPVGYIEILTAKKVTPYQWQCVVDVKNAHTGTDFNFSEFTLCDPDKNTIAIYGNPTQALYAVTDVLDNALLAVNIVLATLPANSIEIIHQNLPLNLMIEEDMAVMLAATGAATVTIMQQQLAVVALQNDVTLLESAHSAALDSLHGKITESEQRGSDIITFMSQKLDTELAGTQEIHAATFSAIGSLSLSIIKLKQEQLNANA